MANDALNVPTLPVYSKRPVINGLGATLTLKASQSGSLIIFDKVDGTTVTLPTTPAVGTYFDFMFGATITSVGAKVITGSASELLVGSVLNCDTDSSDAVAIWKALVASSYISVIFDGSTKGGIKGDFVRLTCLNATTWHATGVTNGTGTVATPFSTT